MAAGLCLLSSLTSAGGSSPCADDGFMYGGQPIHPGCIRELVSEVNGDHIVGSVNLGRTPGRGCDRSNRYLPEGLAKEDGYLIYTDPGTGVRFGYRHRARLAPGLHHLDIREISTGSFTYVDSVVVRFYSQPVLERGEHGFETRRVDRLSLVAISDGRGPIEPKDYAELLEAYEGLDPIGPPSCGGRGN